MTAPALALVTPDTPAAPANKPTTADKLIVAEYVAHLKTRGFCKLDDSTSNYTRLYNRFNNRVLPLSFIDNDFHTWLFNNKKKCFPYSTSYIIFTLPHVVGSKFKPVDSPYIVEAETVCKYVNTYRKYKPTTHSKDVSPLFLEYLERLVPDTAERHIFNQWVSHCFQRPEQRPSWHILLTSEPGTGKGFLLQEILRPLLLHTSVVSSYSKVMGKFSNVLEDQLLVLLDDCKAKSDDTQTQLKSILSEERAYCEKKGLQGGMVDTYTRFILASNELRPLYMDETDRRWWSPARLLHRVDAEETQRFIQSLADWLALDGSLCAVYSWFMAYDLTGFNHKHIDQSANLKTMIGMSQNVHLQFLVDFIAETGNEVFTNADLMKAYTDAEMQRPASKQVPHLLREVKYESTSPRINGKQQRLCHPIGMSLDKIREIIGVSAF